MPVYKKKSKKLFRMAPKIKKEAYVKNRIKQSKSDVTQPKHSDNSDELKIIKGRKLEQKRKLRITSAVCAFLVAVFLVFQFSLPIGLGEFFQNFFAKLGSGTYPIEIQGTDLISSKSVDGSFFVLSNTSLTAYNSSGKEMISYIHGYEKPVIKNSASRVIVFNQGGKNAAIFNLNEQKSTIKTKNEIITAAISRCGTYAIATNSEQYATTVSVYNKSDELLYEWYSSEDIVNNIALSPNGKKLAVSTVNAKGGRFLSKVSVLEFDSATPVYSKEYKDIIIYSLETAHNRGFWCVSENQIKFVKWSNFEEKEYNFDYSLSHFVADGGGAVAVLNRLNDRNDTKIIYFNKKGDHKNEFSFDGYIGDISAVNGHIYCVSENSLFKLNKKGETIKKNECGFGAEKIYVSGNYDVAVMSDNIIEKVKLE